MKYWSRVSFGKVINEDSRSVEVKNEDGLQWTVSRDIFDKEFTVADEYSSEGETNRTEILKKIKEYPRTAMTICFRKKVEPKAVAEEIQKVSDCIAGLAKYPERGGLVGVVKRAMKGKERVMKGRHHGQMDAHGRLRVMDMEDPKRIEKSVDPRTIEWAIIKGVKYVVKG